MKEIEIDFKGYEKQRRDEIIKTGKYAKIEIVVGEDGDPYCFFNVGKITNRELTFLLLTMKEIGKVIVKRHPEIIQLMLDRNITSESIVFEDLEECDDV